MEITIKTYQELRAISRRYRGRLIRVRSSDSRTGEVVGYCGPSQDQPSTLSESFFGSEHLIIGSMQIARSNIIEFEPIRRHVCRYINWEDYLNDYIFDHEMLTAFFDREMVIVTDHRHQILFGGPIPVRRWMRYASRRNLTPFGEDRVRQPASILG